MTTATLAHRARLAAFALAATVAVGALADHVAANTDQAAPAVYTVAESTPLRSTWNTERAPRVDYSRRGDATATGEEVRLRALAEDDAPVARDGSPVAAGDRPGVEEDEAGWDCRTMGNRACGRSQDDARAATRKLVGEDTYHGPTQCFEDGSCRQDGDRVLSPAQAREVIAATRAAREAREGR